MAMTAYPALAQNSVKAIGKPLPAQVATSTAAARNQLVQQRIETQKENVENRIAAMKEQIASREAALKAKLQAFKDKKKAQIADRVNTALNRINENQTTQMKRHLGTMTTILDKLEVRVNQAAPDIKDPAAAKAAIASARAAISTASAAVTAQSEKDYTITVTSESKIGVDAKTQRDKLHTDLQAARKLVIDAKQAVANAIRTAKAGSLPVGKTVLEKEGTESGQQ